MPMGDQMAKINMPAVGAYLRGFINRILVLTWGLFKGDFFKVGDQLEYLNL